MVKIYKLCRVHFLTCSAPYAKGKSIGFSEFIHGFFFCRKDQGKALVTFLNHSPDGVGALPIPVLNDRQIDEVELIHM